MPPFTVNPQRVDPYKAFKFRVRWDGRVVAGVSRVSALRRTTDVIEYRDGTASNGVRRSPGATRADVVVLERGVTHDTDFEAWANLVFAVGAGAGDELALANFRKDVVIELLNEAGQLVKAYRLYRCWPSEFSALPELDANGGAIAIESLVLQVEGWERDPAVVEPAEPSGTG